MATPQSVRRSHPRAAADWELLLGETRAKHLRARGWTVDVGPGGLRVICDESFHPDTPVRMLLLAGRRLMRLKGTVVRADCLGDGEFEFGIALERPSHRNAAILRHPHGRPSPRGSGRCVGARELEIR